MHPSCWNFGRRRDELDSWKMLRAFAFTLSILQAVPPTRRSHIICPKRSWEKLNGLAVSDCTAYEDFMENFWEIFSWMTNIFTSLFHFWWSCRSDQLVSPLSDFTNFTIDFRINFTMSKTLKTVLWKWAKTPLHLSLDPGNGRWVAMFERQL